MSHDEQMKQREALQARFKALVLEYIPLAVNPTSMNQLSDEKKYAMAVTSMIAANIKWDVDQAVEIAAELLEDVNFHAGANVLREM